jgi:DNA-binding response OmpR family regulator
MRLLLVEDDERVAVPLARVLSQAGYAVDRVADGVEAEYLGREEPYDVIVLDLGLPSRSGLEVLRNWRARGVATPVIVLTARGAWHERVEGFQAGADDYVPKPFHDEELLARIAAVLRRALGGEPSALCVGGLALDEEHQQAVLPDGRRVALTGTEFRLLRYFMLHPDRPLSKSRLAEHVYAYDDDRDSNVIEVYVNRLRRKLGRDRIVTRRGQGYLFPSAP